MNWNSVRNRGLFPGYRKLEGVGNCWTLIPFKLGPWLSMTAGHIHSSDHRESNSLVVIPHAAWMPVLTEMPTQHNGLSAKNYYMNGVTDLYIPLWMPRFMYRVQWSYCLTSGPTYLNLGLQKCTPCGSLVPRPLPKGVWARDHPIMCVMASEVIDASYNRPPAGDC